MRTYPAIRYHHLADRPVGSSGMDSMGVLTGEFRAPKAGEWYLSGAIPEGYRAPNDLTQAFYILRIVRVVRETVIREIEP